MFASRRNLRSSRVTDRYQDKVLVDDVAGERLPPHIPKDQIILASDLPTPVRIVRVDVEGAGSITPPGLAWSSKGETLVLAVDSSGMIKMATIWARG
ncbi:hypothetical protein H4219_002523 [Mycoemilia scoparia]|uniref:Uncharacterized protein n=1 Tax=Mycoemilia scoparia TaxID=417184 RepID=A0A9W8A343_9FUNG|nr:hypothetical protein H4219_002523 [Mycoemilia scoparia]